MSAYQTKVVVELLLTEGTRQTEDGKLVKQINICISINGLGISFLKWAKKLSG